MPDQSNLVQGGRTLYASQLYVQEYVRNYILENDPYKTFDVEEESVFRVSRSEMESVFSNDSELVTLEVTYKEVDIENIYYFIVNGKKYLPSYVDDNGIGQINIRFIADDEVNNILNGGITVDYNTGKIHVKINRIDRDMTAKFSSDFQLFVIKRDELPSEIIENDISAYRSLSLGRSMESEAGYLSSALGDGTVASGDNSLAQGSHTVSMGDNQFAHGRYNIIDYDNNYAHIIGNGINGTERSNAHTVDWEGNAVFAGKVTVGRVPENEMDLVNKGYVDDAISGAIADMPETDLSDYALRAELTSYALKTEVPNRMSQLQNDKGFLTEHQSIDHKADITFVEEYVWEAYDKLIDSAPEVLNTLGELAKALGEDENFSTTITNQLSLKANKSDLENLVDISDLDQYARISDLETKADRSELNAYATKTELNLKADKSALDDYVTKTLLNTRMDNLTIKRLTKSAYEALTTKDPNTLYIIVP